MVSVTEAVKERRSIRKYERKMPSDKEINTVLDAGRWTPSGLNNQPWKFKALQGDKKDGLGGFTRYEYVIKNAPAAICVFLDKNSTYNRDKDLMAIGACIQNMLLQAHALGLGTCWLGEILNKRKDVEKYLNIAKDCELMAVITIGFPAELPKSTRRPLDAIVLK